MVPLIRIAKVWVIFAAVLWPRFGVEALPVINEFLASNQGGLKDERGNTPDWIEIFNPGPEPVNLAGWALTDVATNLTKWSFPATNLSAGNYLVVFASGDDRRIPGLPLHTNFKLSEEGEYLGLVTADGSTVVSEFVPKYRAQYPNIAFGLAPATTVTLLDAEAPARARVPEDASEGIGWRLLDFADSTWPSGTGGVGYESTPADYAGLLGLDVREEMLGRNTSVYVRVPFTVERPEELTGLRLQIQYDDGFVAWLNGREVARRNAPDSLTWNSPASGDHPDGLAVVPEEIDLTAFAGELKAGANVLAIQGLNNGLGSSDLLVRAALEADRAGAGISEAYFPQPTPGDANRGGTPILGPLIHDANFAPTNPAPADDVWITARVTPTEGPVSTVNLIHRVRFTAELTMPMFDDGMHSDGAAGDLVYGARIPAGTAGAGDLVRYRIEAADSEGRSARLPLYFDPRDSEQYFGWVVANPGITSALPVVHLFVQNVSASESFSGTRASLSYLGELYDNLEIRVHGQSSSGFPKKSFNLDFPRDHRFRYATNKARVKDIRLLTNYGDKSRLHNTLAYETIAAAGSIGHFAFPVRVQRNAAFHGILDMVEDGDDRWLERVNLSPDGALYKVYDALESPGGSEKKNRREEGNSDLQALISGLSPSRPLATRVTYAYDNLDLPQTISYFVGLAIVSSQDHGHKNYYAYRDTTGSGDWTIFPWDVDLTFGRNWTDSGGYFTDTIYTNNVLNFYNSSQQGKPANRLYNLIFGHPEFRRMYLRRLRTVMDTVLQAPDTLPTERGIDARIRALLGLLDPTDLAKSDADLDEAKWTAWGAQRTTRAEAQRILDVYLPGRRNFLFKSPNATVSGEHIPDAQATQVAIQLDEFDFNPVSGRQKEEFIRLTNAEPVAVDVSGWRLQGQLRHTFRPGTVIPAGRTLYVSPDVAAFRNRTISPKRGENVFVQGNYDGQLSARGGTVELLNSAGSVVSVLAYPGAPTSLQQALRLSELMFHPTKPPSGSPYDAEDFEFIELKNVGSQPLNLLGAQFNEGVTFAFTNSSMATMAPGARALVVKNRAAFESGYGAGLPVVGEYVGSLANEGESVRLQDVVGETVFEFRYDPIWFTAADGGGRSLEPVSPAADLDLVASWRPTSVPGGTPGRTSWLLPIESFNGDDTGRLIVRAQAEAGNTYRLEGASKLDLKNWDLLTPARSGPEQTILEFSIPTPAADTQYFLRVKPE